MGDIDIVKKCIENCGTIDNCSTNCDIQRIYEMSLGPPGDQILFNYLQEQNLREGSSELTIKRLLHFFLGMSGLPPPYDQPVAPQYEIFLKKTISVLKLDVLVSLEKAIVQYRKNTNPFFSLMSLPRDVLLNTIREVIISRLRSGRKRRPSVTRLANSIRKHFVDEIQEEKCTLNTVRINTGVFMPVFKRFNLLGKGKYIVWKFSNNEKQARVIENTHNTNLDLCAIIVSYVHTQMNIGGGHTVSYVKIFDTWYNADDTDGVLRARTNGQPTWNTSIYRPGDYKVAEMNYMYTDKKHIQATRFLTPYHTTPLLDKGEWHGIPTFLQSGRGTCAIDGLSSCIFYANGFRDIMTDIFNFEVEGQTIFGLFDSNSGESTIGAREQRLISAIKDILLIYIFSPPIPGGWPQIPDYVVKTDPSADAPLEVLWKVNKNMILYKSPIKGDDPLISDGLFYRVLNFLSISCLRFLSIMKYIYLPQKRIDISFDTSIGIKNDPDRIKRKGRFITKNTTMTRARDIKSHIAKTGGISRFFKSHAKKKSIKARKITKSAFVGRTHLGKKSHRRASQGSRKISARDPAISLSRRARTLLNSAPASRATGSRGRASSNNSGSRGSPTAGQFDWQWPLRNLAVPASRAAGSRSRASSNNFSGRDPHAGQKE